MSFAGFVQTINPVSRWWRRGHSIQITLWPNWLAQRLCPHDSKTFFGPSDEPPDKNMWRCEDCFLFHMPEGWVQAVEVPLDPNDGGTGDPK